MAVAKVLLYSKANGVDVETLSTADWLLLQHLFAIFGHCVSGWVATNALITRKPAGRCTLLFPSLLTQWQNLWGGSQRNGINCPCVLNKGTAISTADKLLSQLGLLKLLSVKTFKNYTGRKLQIPISKFFVMTAWSGSAKHYLVESCAIVSRSRNLQATPWLCDSYWAVWQLAET